MLWHESFEEMEWQNGVPRYEGPGSSSRLLALDFDALSAMAGKQKDIGAFQPDPDEVIYRAPLYLEDLPAAFYIVESAQEGAKSILPTGNDQTLVVLSGVLRIQEYRQPKPVIRLYDDTADAELSMLGVQADDQEDHDEVIDLATHMRRGDVRHFQDQILEVEAAGVHGYASSLNPARCLAIALYGDALISLDRSGVPILTSPSI